MEILNDYALVGTLNENVLEVEILNDYALVTLICNHLSFLVILSNYDVWGVKLNNVYDTVAFLVTDLTLLSLQRVE